LKEIIGLFENSVASQLSALKEILAKNEPRLAGAILHKLKGTLSNFGNNPAFHAAEALEQLVEKNSCQEQNEVFELLRSEIQNLKTYLEESVHENLAC
jgi:HPt (histidine-containing phosphotransfer) domain-containing protein